MPLLPPHLRGTAAYRLALLTLSPPRLAASEGERSALDAARAAGVTIATGYAMIAVGGVGLIGAALPLLTSGSRGLLPAMGIASLLPALGFAAICLGLGFTHAVATLRAVVREAMTAGRSPGRASMIPSDVVKDAGPTSGFNAAMLLYCDIPHNLCEDFGRVGFAHCCLTWCNSFGEQ